MGKIWFIIRLTWWSLFVNLIFDKNKNKIVIINGTEGLTTFTKFVLKAQSEEEEEANSKVFVGHEI